jgi:hypothetical protein
LQIFPLAEIAQAHRVSEEGHVRGELVPSTPERELRLLI